MSETVDFLNLLLVISIECNLKQFHKMGRYCNDYYEKFPEAIKLKCGYDLDYIIKYVSCKKREMQLQVSNICHVNNIFRTRCLSPMYCVNLAKTALDQRLSISTVTSFLRNILDDAIVVVRVG